jgi:hypothetical protein
MPIPAQLNALIQRLYNELEQLEYEVTAALNLVRIRLNLFPDNAMLIQLFAYLNNVMFLRETLRSQLSNSEAFLETDIATESLIREVAEDLSEQLGRVLEAKIAVNRIRERLDIAHDSEDA